MSRSRTMRRPRFTTPAILLALPLMAGCGVSRSGLEDLPPELRQASITSVQNPSARLAAARTYSFMAGSGPRGEDPRYPVERIDRMIRDAIEGCLAEKRLVAVPGGRGDLLVGYVTVLEGALDDGTVDRALEVVPGGLPAGARRYDKGVVVVDILDPSTRMSVWRGSVEVVADPDLDDATRRQRIQQLARMLFARLDLAR